MSTKPKGDVKVLKGQEAEDAVLDYLKKMNRPFGAVDVSANLKGAVPKTATQKILVALAEKGEIVQKTYGKTAFFVANQANLEDMPAQKVEALDLEYKKVDEENKTLVAEIKALNAELARVKSTPTDDELLDQIEETTNAMDQATAHLTPLRSGAPIISESELEQLGRDWGKWRNEWVRRRKIYHTFWGSVTDATPPQEAAALAEDLGIEDDTPEHANLERSPLCSESGSTGKRRRLK